ncbi:hypothetical protein niasHS_003052 [Heterodera schachtii]|uniref:RING-type domain-containing protein n=1 Tax=Heterodera schachtii TaxID=97005 RepID=A0ABD2K9T1_HETSC
MVLGMVDVPEEEEEEEEEEGREGKEGQVGNRHLARSPPPPPPPGLTRTELTQIFPVVEVDEAIAEEICTICQEHLVATSLEATVTPCGHYFHFDCARGGSVELGDVQIVMRTSFFSTQPPSSAVKMEIMPKVE